MSVFKNRKIPKTDQKNRKVGRYRFPNVVHVARQNLAIPATSVGSDRVCSRSVVKFALTDALR